MFFQNPQQFDLRAHRHVADFVEEQRPTICVLEGSFAIGNRIGVRTANVSEQFALDQIL